MIYGMVHVQKVLKVLVFSAAVSGGVSAFGGQVDRKGGWRDLDSSTFSLPAYPAAGSQLALLDTQVLLTDQAQRTEAQCARIESMGGAGFQLFKPALSDKKYGQVKSLLNDVADVASNISKEEKAQFQRPRPANEDNRIQPCHGIQEGGYSYPSSHATVAATCACVLAKIFPNKQVMLDAFARDIGQLRVIGGFHHPSDIQAGQTLGADICQRLLNDSDFQKELKDVETAVAQAPAQ